MTGSRKAFFILALVAALSISGCTVEHPQEIAEYQVRVESRPEGAGKVTGGGIYKDGETVTMEAGAADAYVFARWEENGREVSDSSRYQFTVRGDRELTAVFKEPAEPDKPAVVDFDPDSHVQFMGQALERQKALEFTGLTEEEISMAGMAVGESYVAFQEKNTAELVFFQRENLQERGRVKTDFDLTNFRSWEGYFWGDLLVVKSRDTEGNDLLAVYGPSDEGITLFWETSLENVKAAPAGKEGSEYLLVYDSMRRNDFVRAGQVSFLKLLVRDGSRLSTIWEKDEQWHVTDVLPYSEDKLLLATADRGWLFVDLRDFSVEELGVGGPHEEKIWNELGRSHENGLVYTFEGVDQSGSVLASVQGRMLAGEYGERQGIFHQIWAPSEEDMKLVAENFSLRGEGPAYWAFHEEDALYTRFAPHHRSSRWLSWKGPGEIDHRDAGGYYSVVELNESALKHALEKGRYGDETRLIPGEEKEKPPAPLSDFFKIRKDFGYRSNSAVTKLSVTGGLDLLLQRSDGVHFLSEAGETKGAVRVTASRIAAGAIDEKHRQVYFFGGGQLFRISYGDLCDVERQTIFPSLRAEWSMKTEGTTVELAEDEEMLYLVNYNWQQRRSSVRAVEKSTGREKWHFKVEGEVSTPHRLAVTADTVRFVDREGSLHVLDAFTGALQKRVQLEFDLDFFQTQLIGDDHVYVSGRIEGRNHLIALDAASGEKLWDFAAASGRIGNVTLLDGLLYMGDGDFGKGFLYVLDPQSGREKEKFETGIVEAVSPVIRDNLLVSGGYGEGDYAYLYALDLESGKMKWQFELGYKAFLMQPAVAGEMIYTLSFSYGDTYGALHALDLQTGNERWINSQYYFHSDPVYSHGFVYVSDQNRYLCVLDAMTGKIKWKFNPSVSTYLFPSMYGGFSLPVVVGDEAVFFAAEDTLQALD